MQQIQEIPPPPQPLQTDILSQNKSLLYFFNTVTKHKPLLNIFYIDVAFSELDWFMGD